jgi:hypothetical protein
MCGVDEEGARMFHVVGDVYMRALEHVCWKREEPGEAG